MDLEHPIGVDEPALAVGVRDGHVAAEADGAHHGIDGGEQIRAVGGDHAPMLPVGADHVIPLPAAGKDVRIGLVALVQQVVGLLELGLHLLVGGALVLGLL